MIVNPLVKEVPPEKVGVTPEKVDIPIKKEELLPKKVDVTTKPVVIFPTKPVVVSPILYKVREITPFQEEKIAVALKESGADSRGQITALEKILKILRVV